MNFNELKPIFDKKTFDILANLTDNPTCELYLPDFTAINDSSYDPFDGTATDSSSITPGERIYIATLRCIYTYDKLLIQETDTQLGSKYTLIIYLRADDMPPEIKANISSTIVKFNDVFYNLNSHLNLYNILYEFSLQ